MNRKQFQKWLDQFDEECIIECVIHSRGSGYYDQGGNATVVTFDPEMHFGHGSKMTWCEKDHFEYTDFRNNRFVKEDQPHFGKQLLRIGAFEK